MTSDHAAATPRDPQPFDYPSDVARRWILFLDVLRQRANVVLDHEAAGKPPVLAFEYETLLDARSFDPPANYALLRILCVGDDRLEDCCDPDKPPVIVVDPRAGHGPGIGGFKRDSEVGIALRAGHPVYFVSFFPSPCPGQTLHDVLRALRRFVEHVSERHDGRAPILYGNCQAGWAVTLLAADCEGLAGPAVLNGSPLSYWSGEAGSRPMRTLGSLSGGAWLPHLAGDLGDGRFDGAWLVQNFELLNPETAVWEKYARLLADPEGERERFLAFERWWNAFYDLSREEIVAIVEDLFVGNRIEDGQVRVCEGCRVDLRRIRNPLVIFASHGDDITPPPQALGWIPQVYPTTEDLKAAEQRIVYLIDQKVGHLGIFVSGKIARREHRAILSNLPAIRDLAPGLYEMRLPDDGDEQVEFVERRVEDLETPRDDEAFERVRQISEWSESLYVTFVSPWIQAAANPWAATMQRWLHPMRVSRWIFSERVNPAMAAIGMSAAALRASPAPAADTSWRQQERGAADAVGQTIAAARQLRDQLAGHAFQQLYAGAADTTSGLGSPQPGAGEQTAASRETDTAAA